VVRGGVTHSIVVGWWQEQAIGDGRVTVNDKPTTMDYVIKNGDYINHMSHRHEPPVSGHPIIIAEETEDYVRARCAVAGGPVFLSLSSAVLTRPPVLFSCCRLLYPSLARSQCTHVEVRSCRVGGDVCTGCNSHGRMSRWVQGTSSTHWCECDCMPLHLFAPCSASRCVPLPSVVLVGEGASAVLDASHGSPA
jgi:hypothetical protein